MNHIKNIGWVVLAGTISVVLYMVILIGLSALVDIFNQNNILEARLIADSFLKPLLLVLAGSWLWLAGRFLTKDKPKSWGINALYIYLAASIIPYLFSFLVTQNA